MPRQKQTDEPELGERIAKIETDLGWVKKGMVALAVLVSSPKVGGPDVSQVTAEALRAFLG